MSSRRVNLTAVPLAIVLGFGAIGVVINRFSDNADASQTDLPFAIAEPVKAKWEQKATASAPSETPFAFNVAEPASNQKRAIELFREKIPLDGSRDVRIGPGTSRSPDFGFLVNNGEKAERVLIDGLIASECSEYGGYIDGASDWWIRNSTLHQAQGATQHGLRIATGHRIRITDTLIDSHLADKTTLWVLNGSDIELRNVKLAGGRSWFSIAPDNPDLPDGSVKNIVIADCWIDCDQDWPNPLEFMPGVDGVTITNLHVRSAKPPIGVWSSADDVPAARNVKWKDIWIPAPHQAVDVPFDDLKWVKVRDDDWERIITHKGQSREQAIANGIGPLTDAPPRE
jgi:hypothetical protein